MVVKEEKREEDWTEPGGAVALRHVLLQASASSGVRPPGWLRRIITTSRATALVIIFPHLSPLFVPE